MATYTVQLRGTKKNSTNDLQVVLTNCNSKGQAFNFAFQFFQKGETDVVYGTKETGLKTIHHWMPNADNLKKYAGKYKVYRTSVLK